MIACQETDKNDKEVHRDQRKSGGSDLLEHTLLKAEEFAFAPRQSRSRITPFRESGFIYIGCGVQSASCSDDSA